MPQTGRAAANRKTGHLCKRLSHLLFADLGPHDGPDYSAHRGHQQKRRLVTDKTMEGCATKAACAVGHEPTDSVRHLQGRLSPRRRRYQKTTGARDLRTFRGPDFEATRRDDAGVLRAQQPGMVNSGD
jgi:hypothetical protein